VVELSYCWAGRIAIIAVAGARGRGYKTWKLMLSPKMGTETETKGWAGLAGWAG